MMRASAFRALQREDDHEAVFGNDLPAAVLVHEHRHEILQVRRDDVGPRTNESHGLKPVVGGRAVDRNKRYWASAAPWRARRTAETYADRLRAALLDAADAGVIVQIVADALQFMHTCDSETAAGACRRRCRTVAEAGAS